ncbi:MAG: hypothetical protein PWP23_79 [Candidatus Sumerlaeota bacterium]|nr:hypothetical protein [Candidatus Sumerlaeota bacterium]
MPLDDREFRKLVDDFASGRNPKAYLPVCQHLRRARRYAEALDFCQRGLAHDERSLAGRVMLARLNADLGRYEDALEEVLKTEEYAPDELSLLVVKCQCQIRLRQIEEAAETYRQLDSLHPFDPQVKMLAAELRAAREQAPPRSSGEVALPVVPLFLPLDEIARMVLRQLEPIAKVHTIGIVDLDSGRTHSEGSDVLVETVEGLFHELSVSLAETEHGIICFGVLEIQKMLVLLFHRDRRMVVLAIDPETNFGKVYHRIVAVLNQYLANVRVSGVRSAG